MKPLIDKFSAIISRFEFLLLAVPFVCWIFCYRHFFTGHLWLEGDATPYAEHIGFYTDNLSRGVFPLWDPTWFNGAPNDFFLRRLGDVNPLLWIMVLLKWAGISSVHAYLVFIGVDYFLAGWAFYLISRFLFGDCFFGFTGYVLFLFSSWGSEVFYNYIIIVFVPIIWFFYFLLCFSRRPQKSYMLGMCLCIGLTVTTYIPFFFLIILALFTFFFVLFYFSPFIGFLRSCFGFIGKNKVFTAFCLFFLISSCVPALLFYKESKSGNFVMPDRHSGADTSSAVAVGLEKAASGDLISHGYFDRIFNDHAHMDMGDIYIPYVFFLILLTSICGRINKLILFLLFNVLALSLITITSAGGIHRFLYEHVLFFKFIRQIYYFFWLAMLPMAILLAVSAFKSLLTAIDASSRKAAWLIYIVICHFLFGLFLWRNHDVLFCAWVAIVFDLFYFLAYFFYKKKVSYPLGFCLIFLAVFVQSAQVYQYLDNKLFQSQLESLKPVPISVNPRPTKLNLYYSTRWFAILAEYIDPVVLENYRAHPFIIYDNVAPYVDNPSFLKVFETTAASNSNVAYVPKFESSPEDWKVAPYAPPQADFNPVGSGKLSVLHTDANTWVLMAHLTQGQFLVVNDNYDNAWRAFINGHPARLLRANVSFKGLWLPQGDSRVVLRFASVRHYLFCFFLMALFAGVFLSLLVLLKRENTDGHTGPGPGGR